LHDRRASGESDRAEQRAALPAAPRLWAMQKLACEATAATEPALAAAAKAGPCSIARNAATGAEVSGSPASQPPKASPQRRATQSGARITNGVRINLVSSRFTGKLEGSFGARWKARKP
jgi:hypothetical protein